MDTKKILYGAIGIVILAAIVFGLRGQLWNTPEIPIDRDVEGSVIMKKIDIVNPAFQPGQTGIGSTEGEKLTVELGGSEDSEEADDSVILGEFKIEPGDDGDVQIKKIELEFTDGSNGENIPWEEFLNKKE